MPYTNKEDANAQRRRYYRSLRERGLCTRCFKPTLNPQRVQCASCRAVSSAKQVARYNQNPTLHISRAIQYRENARTEALQAYGGKCACCGETYPPYLQFDHINGGGTEHRKQLGKGGSNKLFNALKAENWPDYIQVLCANCHTAKSNRKPCPPH